MLDQSPSLGAKRGPGMGAGPQPNPEGVTLMQGQPYPNGHSLDVAVVEGAVVIHLQRQSACHWGCKGQGTAPVPPPSMRAGAGWAQSIPNLKPLCLGAHVPTHQVKVAVVAQVVPQRVLGDVVALPTDQLPIDLGEECWSKDTCGDGGTRGEHPQWWDLPRPGDTPSPTHLPQRGRAGPS